MSIEVSFRPLYGSGNDGPLASVLDIDGFKILLDCGWAEPYNTDLLTPLKEVASTIDAVMISAPDMAHLGALPYVIANFGLKAPVYATNPAFKFGEALLYDALQSQQHQSDFALFGQDQIDEALDQMVQVKYHQRVYFHGKGEGIDAMCYCGARVVGSAVWKITKGAETVLYAVDFGHTRDKKLLLNPCDIGEVKRPSVMITDGLAYLAAQEDKMIESKKSSTENAPASASSLPTANIDRFFEIVLKALSQGGDAFIPIDTCGRALDLIHQFEMFWAANQAYAQHRGALTPQHELRKYVSCPVFFLSNTAYSTLEFAKAQLEWMNDTYADQFCDTRSNIWNLQYVQLIHSMAEISKVSRPRVILATTQSLDSGFSFDLFTQLAPLKTTSIIFTYRGTDGSLAQLLQRKFIHKENLVNVDPSKIARQGSRANGHAEGGENGNSMHGILASTTDSNKNGAKFAGRLTTMERFKFERDFQEDVEVLTIFDHDKRVPLVGEELEAYRERKKIERQEWEARKKAEREAEALRLQEEMKANEEKSIDHGSRIFDLWRGFDLTSDAMTKVRARGQHPMFPYIEPRTAFDDYGELFRLPSVLQEEEAERLKAKQESQADEDLPPEEEAVPTTAITQDISIPIHANIYFIDLEGRCDVRTFQNSIVNEVQPQSMAFVHTPQAQQNSISSFFSRLGKSTKFPQDGEVIDVASHRNMRSIVIEHTTYKDLQFFPLQDYQVAIVSGTIENKVVVEPDTGEKKPIKTTEPSLMDVDPTAAPEEAKTDHKMEVNELAKEVAVLALDKAATSDKEQLFIGDVKLREFKEILDKDPRGFKTLISGAILTVNEVVTVQREGKAGQSTLIVDGPLCETYFLVRTLLYSRLTNL